MYSIKLSKEENSARPPACREISDRFVISRREGRAPHCGGR